MNHESKFKIMYGCIGDAIVILLMNLMPLFFRRCLAKANGPEKK